MGRGDGIYWQANRSQYQHAWETKSGVVTVRVALEPEIVAVLDQVAIDLYERNPHDPTGGEPSSVTPGRAEAIRFLARAYWKQRGKRKTQAISLRRLVKLRKALADFWRAEASYRRSRTGRTRSGRAVLPPRAPWE